jgi:preprotein translocase subunit SecD
VPRRPGLRVTVSVLARCVAVTIGGCTSSRTHHTNSATKPLDVTSATTPVATSHVQTVTVHSIAVLRPVTLGGTSPSTGQLAAAANILTQRFIRAGQPSPIITIAADGSLRFSIPSKLTGNDIADLVARGSVAFRTVLGTTTAKTAARPIPADSGARGDLASDLARAKAAVGSAAYTLAASLKVPATDADTVRRLAAFGQLSPDEIAALPARMQFNVPTVTCAQLTARDALFLTDDRFRTRAVTACDCNQPNVKYLLDAAKLNRSDLAGAAARYDPVAYAASGGWTIDLTFTPTGQRNWTKLTRAEVDHQIAILADAAVMSAPRIQSPVTGPAVVAGTYVTEPVARRVADLVDAGSLPVEFAVTAVSVTG